MVFVVALKLLLLKFAFKKPTSFQMKSFSFEVKKKNLSPKNKYEKYKVFMLYWINSIPVKQLTLAVSSLTITSTLARIA